MLERAKKSVSPRNVRARREAGEEERERAEGGRERGTERERERERERQMREEMREGGTGQKIEDRKGE